MSSERNQQQRLHRYRVRNMVLSLAGALAFASTSAFSGEVTGRIEFIQSGHGITAENVYVLVKINATTTSPACPDPRFAINPTTNAGKVLLALVTTAKASGATVYLVGTGTCLASNYENLSWMRVLD